MLPEFVIDALAETAKGKGRDDLLWQSAAGAYIGPPASKESWLSGAVARCQKADPTFPRVTAHALRHTAASLAISAGANPKVVQRMLGHASAAMTLDVYADLFDSDLTGAAATRKSARWQPPLWARPRHPDPSHSPAYRLTRWIAAKRNAAYRFSTSALGHSLRIESTPPSCPTHWSRSISTGRSPEEGCTG